MIPAIAFAEDGDGSGGDRGASTTSPKATWIGVDETNFPDPEFRKYVATNFDVGYSYYDENSGSYISGSPAKDGYLCEGEIGKATSVSIQDSSLEDITGVELLTSLKSLRVYNCYLSDIEELPDSITDINLCFNSLQTLPKLPSGLESLNCAVNDLTALPQLPQSLTALDCQDNNLTSLPNLSSNLKELRCQWNKLTALPELPNSLTYIDCSNNKSLSSLPTLPISLETLDADSCGLRTIPVLSSNLKVVHLRENKLEGLMDISSYPSLSSIDLCDNLLTGLKVSDKAKYIYVNVDSNIMEGKNAVTGRDDMDWSQVFYFGTQKTYCQAYGHSLSSKIVKDKACVGQTEFHAGTAYRECTKCDYNTLQDDKAEVIPAVKSIKLSSTSYTYSGKAIKPKVAVYDTAGKKLSASNYTVKYSSGRKNVGKYKVTVYFKGSYYTGSRYVTFNINPKGTYLTKVSAGKKAFTAKWKKQSNKMATSRITGYQIRYSTSSKMKSPKTLSIKGYSIQGIKIVKLQGNKKYYVQVRTYKTVKGKNYYSSWSKIKSVKTKGPASPHKHSWKPVYEKQMVYVRTASICSACGADITGNTSAHMDFHLLNGIGCGHYSKPIYEERTVLVYYKCSCGAIK